MRRALRGSVVVIVGASSGVGRATAVDLAGRGAHVVLAGRKEASLQELARECRSIGPEPLVVATDVTEPAAIDALVAKAVSRFGRIDTWIDTAAALLAGDVTALPVEEIDALIAVNVRGTLLSSRAALRQFDAQRHGVLINVSSVLGVVPNPVVPVYTMSKFAVRGLSLSLHYTGRPRAIQVCTVLPGPIDTPMFQHAANHTRRVLRAVPPACAPERVAAAVVSCARRPRRQVPVGFTARTVLAGLRVAPHLTEWAVAAYSGRMLLRREPQAETSGTLFTPERDGSMIDGGWRRGGAVRRRAGAALARATSRA